MKNKILFILLFFGYFNNLFAFHEDEFCKTITLSKNVNEGIEKWKPLAEKGDANAQYCLGLQYTFGSWEPDPEKMKDEETIWEPDPEEMKDHKGYQEAIKWFKKAAEQGYARAQYKLGGMYKRGEGVSRDDKEAVKWYKKASEQVAMAKFLLGGMYARGEGVIEDDQEALRLMGEAAEEYANHHADAEVFENSILFWIIAGLHDSHYFFNDEGFSKNDNEAFKWYQKLLKRGDWSSQYNLAVHYAEGRGVNQDTVKAEFLIRKFWEDTINDDVNPSYIDKMIYGNSFVRYIHSKIWIFFELWKDDYDY